MYLATISEKLLDVSYTYQFYTLCLRRGISKEYSRGGDRICWMSIKMNKSFFRIVIWSEWIILLMEGKRETWPAASSYKRNKELETNKTWNSWTHNVLESFL